MALKNSLPMKCGLSTSYRNPQYRATETGKETQMASLGENQWESSIQSPRRSRCHFTREKDSYCYSTSLGSALPDIWLMARPCCHTLYLWRVLLATISSDFEEPSFSGETETMTKPCSLEKRAGLPHLKCTASTPHPPCWITWLALSSWVQWYRGTIGLYKAGTFSLCLLRTSFVQEPDEQLIKSVAILWRQSI